MLQFELVIVAGPHINTSFFRRVAKTAKCTIVYHCVSEREVQAQELFVGLELKMNDPDGNPSRARIRSIHTVTDFFKGELV